MTSKNVKEYDFSADTKAGLLVCAGGFEDRAVAFVKRLKKTRCSIEHSLLIQYKSQKQDNEPNYLTLHERLPKLLGKLSKRVSVHSNTPIASCGKIRERIAKISERIEHKTALVDISGMTHLWALATIHACIACNFRVTVIYTEARSYFPLKRDENKLLRAWKKQNYEICGEYLQSLALLHIHILPQFSGNFRPGKQTCLMVFAGYEPNRIQGLVDDYAPGRLIVLYGKSPRPELGWRTHLSRELHKELFSRWYIRETDISTLEVRDTLTKLEDEFAVVQGEYDVAIAPQCSKMQAVASYLFWRKHPEVQLVFTTPVRFNPRRYSKRARRTYKYDI